jgi:glyoxylase-like metal-dependent hydrolase (beta-lactamase superfamily II)
MENPYEDRLLPLNSITSGDGQQVLADLFCLPIQIVNVCFVGRPGQSEWVLVDAGMPRSADLISRVAAERFSSKPAAIVLTHGHFDHVGAIVDLVRHWDVPVYAHALEMPYLTGMSDYPPPDPVISEGLVAGMSPLFPNAGINLENHVQTLPSDGSVPYMPDWQWIHTPGHTPGHISLFREKDRALIAGDAFCTVKQESLYHVMTQEIELSGPPKYFTPDWEAAWKSVNLLAALNPVSAVTGHGRPLSGAALTAGLHRLAEHFDKIAIPEEGRYVRSST